MNIEETKKAIEVMQAYVDGGTVINGSGQCFKITETAAPSWVWATGVDAYAIKPKPVERWIAVWDANITHGYKEAHYCYHSESDCIKKCSGGKDFVKAIKLVQPDES